MRPKSHLFWASILLSVLYFCFFWKRLFFFGQAPVDGNLIAMAYPNWRLLKLVPDQHGLFFWNPYRNLGEPFMADPQTMALYPPAWLFLKLDFLNFMRAWVFFHTGLAALFMGLWVHRRHGSAEGAVAAALLAGFNGFFCARLPFPNHLAAAAWLPAILYFQESSSSVGVGFCLAVQWLAGFPPFSILSVAAAFGLGLLKGWKGLLSFALGVVLGTGLSALQWLPFLEMLQHSARGFMLSAQAATQYSLPARQLLKELFLPQWYRLDPRMVGDPAIVSFYIGPIAWILVLRSLLPMAKEEIGVAVGVGLAAFLSLGQNLAWYSQLGFLRVFRFPANWLLLTAVGAGFLCSAGIAHIRSAVWRAAALLAVALDLLLFAQLPKVAWADPSFYADIPALSRQILSAPQPSRVIHSPYLMDLWQEGRLETPEDYRAMREYLAPSWGAAFGVQEAASYQVLSSSAALRFRQHVYAEGLGSRLLDFAGVSAVVSISTEAQRVEPRFMRFYSNTRARPRVFFEDEGVGLVKPESYAPGSVHVHVDSVVPAPLIFSEADYPGWRAYISGTYVPISSFEDVFMSIPVPQGRHEVYFDFDLPAFHKGLSWSLMTGAAMLVFFVWGGSRKPTRHPGGF